MFNKNKKIIDERIIAQTQKSCSNAYNIMITLLGISVFIKTSLLDMSFKYFASELTILFIGGMYVIIHSLIDGNLDMGFKGHNSKINVSRAIAYSLIGGIVFSIGIGFINYFKYQFDIKMLPMIIIPLFIQFSILSFVGCWICDTISRKRNKKQEQEMNLDDK